MKHLRYHRFNALDFISLFFVLFLSCVGAFILPGRIFADELSDIEKKLTDLNKALSMSKNATSNLQVGYTKLQAQLTDIQQRVVIIQKEVAKKEQEVKEGDALLSEQQSILEDRVRSFYKRSYQYTPLMALFTSKNLESMAQTLMYHKYITNEDKKVITALALYIKDLEEKKASLENEKARLAAVKIEVDKQAAFLKKEIEGAQAYQASLSKEIASLSARQKDLIAQKLASLNLPTSLGAGPLFCTDDRKIDPGFSPAFAFFTFGIPHRVGLNQYGALGRARAGQNYQDILRAYFADFSFEKRDSHMKIKVQGYGEMDLDTYLLGIYEMPGDWPIEALKAQVVSARSYALAYTNNGQSEICTTQSCQVYKGGNKGGNWEQAVKQTEGEVMVSGGQVISAWYASTFGGYSLTSGEVGWNNRSWTKHIRDTNGDVNSFSDLFDRAYDKDSPCFYAAQGFRSQYNKSAWIKPDELADIVNVLLLSKKDSSTQKHLSQPDKPNPDGDETWNADRVKQELKDRGVTPFGSVQSVSVDWDKGGGKTTNISFSGDGGSVSFGGDEFRSFFNLRAPANIQIVGPLYNVERR